MDSLKTLLPRFSFAPTHRALQSMDGNEAQYTSKKWQKMLHISMCLLHYRTSSKALYFELSDSVFTVFLLLRSLHDMQSYSKLCTKLTGVQCFWCSVRIPSSGRILQHIWESINTSCFALLKCLHFSLSKMYHIPYHTISSLNLRFEAFP